MSERTDFYVYVIFRPWNLRPCYVGKGRGDRYLQHERAGTKHYNRRLVNIFVKARRLGLEAPVAKTREGLTDAEAIRTEIALIAAIGRGGRNWLVNLTDGGDGTSGHVPSQETREKKRRALKGRKRPPHVGEAVRRAAQNRSEAYRENQRFKHLGKKPSAETRAKMSRAQKGRRFSLEHIEHLKEAWVRREPCSEKTREKLRISASRPDRVAALIQRNLGNNYGKGNKRTLEGQARVTASVIESNKRRVATDEYREKRRAIAKKMWRERRERAAAVHLED